MHRQTLPKHRGSNLSPQPDRCTSGPIVGEAADQEGLHLVFQLFPCTGQPPSRRRRDENFPQRIPGVDREHPRHLSHQRQCIMDCWNRCRLWILRRMRLRKTIPPSRLMQKEEGRHSGEGQLTYISPEIGSLQSASPRRRRCLVARNAGIRFRSCRSNSLGGIG